MKKYLLDTNICIYFIKGMYALDAKLKAIGPEYCMISEITLAELKFGVENSAKKEQNQRALEIFLSGITVVPIFHSLDIYAKEKSRLRKAGTPIDDFDLLIGATAIANKLTLITNNTQHFNRMEGIELEDWTK